MKDQNTKKANLGILSGLCTAMAVLIMVALPTLLAQQSETPDSTPPQSRVQRNNGQEGDDPNTLNPKNTTPEDPNRPTEEKTSEEESDDSMIPDRDDMAELFELFGRIFNEQLVSENGDIDYAMLRRKRVDLVEAARMLDNLHPLVLMSLSTEERIAFWINTYNVCTIRLIIDNYPIQAKWYMILYPGNSIMQIPGAWDKVFFGIQRLEYNLREIRNKMLLERYKDPRICFALTDAARGGAMLRNEPILPEKLDEQLDDQVRRFLASNHGARIDAPNNVIYLSNVFVMNKSAFLASEYAEILKFRTRKPDERAWLNFLFKYLPSQDAAWLEANDVTIRFIEFDWTLNEKRPG